MVIRDIQAFSAKDVAKYAWSRISHFQNVSHTTNVIASLHALPQRHLTNAKSQAEELKYCLSQAKEYFDAAAVVSLATRPLLLYYGAMSMALAEILLKQSADSRLAKLREHHDCHGLCFVVESDLKPTDSLGDATRKLSAKAQTLPTGDPKGTFEIWRRSAREYPVGGYTKKVMVGATEEGYQTLLYAADIAPRKLDSTGLSLSDCLGQLPYMHDLLLHFGGPFSMVRATIKQEENAGVASRILIVHPTEQVALEQFQSQLQMPADSINYVQITELDGGFILQHQLLHDRPGILHYPEATCLTTRHVFFSCKPYALNEFGHLYVALHICGNLARYYPDLWLKHIQVSSPLAMAIDELCSHATERLPLLCLSELLRKYLIAEG